MDGIDTVERLLCDRYNVRTLGEGELTDALATARAGDMDALRGAIAKRELYGWRTAIDEAVASIAVAEPEPVSEAEPETAEPVELEPDDATADAPPRGRRR